MKSGPNWYYIAFKMAESLLIAALRQDSGEHVFKYLQVQPWPPYSNVHIQMRGDSGDGISVHVNPCARKAALNASSTSG